MAFDLCEITKTTLIFIRTPGGLPCPPRNRSQCLSRHAGMFCIITFTAKFQNICISSKINRKFSYFYVSLCRI